MKTKQQKRAEARARFNVLDYPGFVEKLNKRGQTATPDLYLGYRERKRIELNSLINNLR